MFFSKFTCYLCGGERSMLTVDVKTGHMICFDRDLCKETKEYEFLMKNVDPTDSR